MNTSRLGVKCNKNFENHPSILEIKKQVGSDLEFPFSVSKVTLTEMISEIKKSRLSLKQLSSI